MRILTVANLVSRKRVDLCALACQELVKRHDISGIKWTVIGRGKREKEVKDLAPISMEFFPKVEDLKGYYKRADVFVLPSCDEGFGMVYIEAIMCGCPVICRKDDGGQEIVDFTGGGIAIDILNSDTQAVKNIIKGIDAIVSNRIRYANDKSKALAIEMVRPERIKRQWSELLTEAAGSLAKG